MVYLNRPHVGKQFQKFQPPFLGPYQIIELRSNDSVVLIRGDGKQLHVHRNRVKLASFVQQMFRRAEGPEIEFSTPNPSQNDDLERGQHLLNDGEDATHRWRLGVPGPGPPPAPPIARRQSPRTAVVEPAPLPAQVQPAPPQEPAVRPPSTRARPAIPVVGGKIAAAARKPAAAARPSGSVPAASGARSKTTGKHVAFRKVTLVTDPEYFPPAKSKPKGLMARVMDKLSPPSKGRPTRQTVQQGTSDQPPPLWPAGKEARAERADDEPDDDEEEEQEDT